MKIIEIAAAPGLVLKTIDPSDATGTALPWKAVERRSWNGASSAGLRDIVDGNGITVARCVVQAHAETIVALVNGDVTAAPGVPDHG